MGKMVRLFGESCTKINNDIFVFSREYNVFFKINMINKNIELMGYIPGKHVYTSRLCTKILMVKNTLYFIPMNEEKLWMLDLDSEKWSSVTILKNEEEKKKNKFFQAIEYNNKIYMIGCSLPFIVVYDLETKEVFRIEKFIECGEDSEDITYFRTHYYLNENELWLASGSSNEVYQVNLDSYSVDTYHVGSNDNRYSGICYDGKSFWLSPRRVGPIVKWDGNNKWDEILIKDNEKRNTLSFLGIMCFETKIICPGMGNYYTVEINKDNHEEYKISSDTFWTGEKLDDENCIFMDKNANIKIKNKMGNQINIDNRISIEDIKYIHYKGGNVLGIEPNFFKEETKCLGLNEYLEMLTGK